MLDELQEHVESIDMANGGFICKYYIIARSVFSIRWLEILIFSSAYIFSCFIK